MLIRSEMEVGIETRGLADSGRLHQDVIATTCLGGGGRKHELEEECRKQPPPVAKPLFPRTQLHRNLLHLKAMYILRKKKP